MAPSFAFCLAPNAAKFFENHDALPYEMSPNLAAMTAIDLSDRIEYGTTRSVCPKQIKKVVQNSLKLAVLEKLSIIYIQEKLFVFAASAVPEILLEALSPKVMGHQSVRGAMAAVIATGPSNGVSCDLMDEAARLYNQYDRPEYVSDVCKGTNTLKEIIQLMKPPKSNGGAIAVKDFETERHINQFKKSDIKFKDPPLCYPCLGEWVETAHESDNAILASSIIDVMENCPVAFNVGD
ncbi:MAG: hypothetical protein GOV00_03230, partial [Candidatus Altiarchaeota archaeon]|nr:hypothetical protein [Candidatus Altiarchaeota archaeon]